MSTNLLSKAAAWVTGQTIAHTADSLTLTRPGAAEPTSLMGTQGTKMFKVEDLGKPVINVESVDFLILVADYKIDDVLTKPKRNDTIKRTIGSMKKTYKVLPLGRDIPLFEYSDTGQTMYRVHTKLDKEEAV